ncbi:hypothetical protein LZ554_008301 [Drepanopeziza brunnea f. sp. 'monogermtubi']|nr:hypothetical protein LZ554_008301 [Drepanopeziza brunnea f. sp. 'monogermtubi']
MARFCEAGQNAMARFYRRRILRLLSVLLILLVLLYVLVAYEPVQLPLITHASKKIQYDTYPTYEYTSVYRQTADLAFENALDESLRGLERETLAQLPPEQQNLATNLTIWQVTTPEDAESLKEWTKQWKDNNQDWFHRLITSPLEELYSHFESIPEIAETNDVSQRVRDDLTRYLLLWWYGGLYTEVDTWDRMPLRDCPPVVNVLGGQQHVSLMLGVEKDEPYLSAEQLRNWHWTRGFGFGLQTVWAPMKFDPILRKAIVRTISHARTQNSRANEWWRGSVGKYMAKTDDSGEVSGKGMFTDLVLEVLSENLKEDHKMRDRDAGLERRVTWKKFRALKEPAWLDQGQLKEGKENDMRGLAVLPVHFWANGQSHSNSGGYDQVNACINWVPGYRPK